MTLFHLEAYSVMMAVKKSLNLAVPEALLDEFNAVCAAYGHGKQKGMVLSAAMTMFLQANPQEQGRYLEQVAQMDIREGVTRMMDRARVQQTLEAATRSALERAVTGVERPRKAAKKKGQPKRAIRKLPNTPSHLC